MATPSGPATPGNPISYFDIVSESNFSPPAGNNGIYDFATYIYDDGFVNDYTFYGAFYPLPSSPAGAITQNASISMFYDIDSLAGIDINFQSGAPAWVADIDVKFVDATDLAGGSNSGPNADNQLQFFGLGYGTQGGSIPHWYELDLQVTLNATGMPPYPAVNIEYDTGGGFTSFPNPPFTFPGLYSTGPISNVANGGTVYIKVY